MRYIRQTVSVSTVSDDEIQDENTANDILSNIAKSSASIKMEYEDPKAEILKKYDVVRVLSVHDSSVDIRASRERGLS